MADNAQRPLPPPSRRRDKAQLSCGPCRHRKYVPRQGSPLTESCMPNVARRKCDRNHPCGACSRRGLANSCLYATTTAATTAAAAPPLTPQAQRPSAPLQSASTLHGRISELESLVVTLMEGRQPLPARPAPRSPRPSSPSLARVSPAVRRQKKARDVAPPSPTDPGTLKLRAPGAGTSYVQSDHWEAILAKIRGLKEDVVNDGTALPGSHLFYGPSRHATRDEILAAVPPRPAVDRLLALHFDSYIVTPCRYIPAFLLSTLIAIDCVCCRSPS